MGVCLPGRVPSGTVASWDRLRGLSLGGLYAMTLSALGMDVAGDASLVGDCAGIVCGG